MPDAGVAIPSLHSVWAGRSQRNKVGAREQVTDRVRLTIFLVEHRQVCESED